MSKVTGRLETAVRKFWRYAHYRRQKTPVFVLGCQRSGTTLLLEVVGRSPKVYSYHEQDSTILDANDFRLLSYDAVRKAMVRTPEPITLFKPLNDSQYADRLLEIHENAKVIWLYRHYRDVVDSAVKKWGDAHKSMVLEVSSGIYSDAANRAIGERVTPENLELVKRLVKKDLSPSDGAALLWYLRNSIYFDINLGTDMRTKLFRYRYLVTRPEEEFGKVFQFIGADYSPAYSADIHASSVGKENDIRLDPEIETLCETMMVRLNDAYDAGSKKAAA